ncbi:pyridoxamine 5'-phosphate oxidase family protein [Candidatus Clostridium radicumherbarum]|uniref:Pyridoxamine 5'-phosphate oxidase family protein n=1 Tax=Candidatus Clostridium radicumherbarum TaxID=3381662 RepID=A0ABW8TU55_9CLOT
MSNTFETMSSYLKQHSILTLSTIGTNGTPALDTVDYMWTGEKLFFFTDIRSRKAANMKNNPSIVAIVAEKDTEFFSAKSVEIYGTSRICEDPAKINAYMQNFMARRPQFASQQPNPEMQKNMVVYEVIPTKLRMLDNTIAPGNIDELELV